MSFRYSTLKKQNAVKSTHIEFSLLRFDNISYVKVPFLFFRKFLKTNFQKSYRLFNRTYIADDDRIFVISAEENAIMIIYHFICNILEQC